MGRVSQFIVLAEDQRHQRFVRQYLKLLVNPLPEIRFEALPSGRGCGEQWVRERYANAVRAYRDRSARAQTALIVALDADAGDSGRRIRQLEDALVRAGLAPRNDGERIVHLIPRRNVETWILNLDGTEVDEETDYSRHAGIEGRITSAAEKLFDWARPNAAPLSHCVPSLRLAIPELRRLE